MPRLIILSHRLPMTAQVSGKDVTIIPSAGGLAAALRAIHRRHESVCVGWPGPVPGLGAGEARAAHARLADMRLLPVDLDEAEVRRSHRGFSNSTLWPLMHHFLGTARFDPGSGFDAYEAVNARIADAAAFAYRPGDTLWVHDYHLMLAAAMLRTRLPNARIGFFLHTPFPGPEVFRAVPQRVRLLRGILGADVVGFQTEACRRHFARTVARVLDLEPGPRDDMVPYEGRAVRLGVYPVGVDAEALSELSGCDAVREETRRIRELSPGRRIVLGVDRLDYTKGIQLRLAAIERMLEHASLRSTTSFVQLAVPTREGIDAYERAAQETHEMAGRISGRYGSVASMPIHLLSQPMPIERLLALYAAADVMVATPLYDGMNLVAKEYVAARSDGAGALVLSEFAGAAEDLKEALIVNPYDTEGVAAAIERALEMPEDEQRTRMAALRRRVAARDVHRWSRSFIDDLAGCSPEATPKSASGRRAA